MLFTLFGIVTEVRLLHLKKAPLPILVTLFGIVKEVKPVHPSNTRTPIFVTLLPISMSLRLLQS